MVSIIVTIALQSITIFILLYLINSNLFLNKANYINVLVLSALLVGVNIIGSTFGFIGSMLAGLANLIIIIRALKYDLGGALLFSIGLGLLNMFAVMMLGQ